MPFVTQTDFAAHMGIVRETVTDYVARGVIKKTASGKYDQDKCRVQIVQWMSARLAGRSASIEEQAEKLSLTRERAQSIRLKNETARGETILVVVVKKALQSIYAGIREVFLGFPGRYAIALEMVTREEAAEILTDAVHEILNELVDPTERSETGDRYPRRAGRASGVETAAETHAGGVG